jgi:hypothetical protein
MNSVRYVGLDVHRDTISAAVLKESGRLIQQSMRMNMAPRTFRRSETANRAPAKCIAVASGGWMT